MARIVLRLSPNGQRAGIVLAASGRHRLTIHVLPKLWRPDGTPSYHTREWEGDSLAIVAHELDYVAIEGSSEKLAVVEAMLQLSDEVAERREEPDRTPLLQLAMPPRKPMEGAVLAAPADLLTLFQRTRGLLSAHTRHRLEGREDLAWLLSPLVRLEFVAEVARRIGTLRQGYREVTDTLTAVRGRVEERSLLLATATGVPRLRCTFDEFTPDTPLSRVVATALDVVAGGASSGPLATDALLRSAPERALRLRRAISHVQSLPRLEAIRVGATLRLDRLSRGWQEGLELALLVLRGQGFLPSEEATRSFAGFELDLPTWRIWEETLDRMLRMSFSDVHHHPSTPAPWAGANLEDSAPDWLVHTGDALWCLDAKYKSSPSGRSPGRDDLYQLYAYSHLATLCPPGGETKDAGVPERLALLYPSSDTAWRRGPRYTRHPVQDPPTTLDAIALPFPRPADTATEGAWGRYLSSTAAILVEALRDADTPADRRAPPAPRA